MLVLTHKGRFKKITKIVKIPYSGETYKVFPYHSLPLDVTPEHPFLSAKIKQKFKKHYTEWDKKQKKYNHNRYDDEKGVSGFENLAWNKVSTLEKGDMLVIPKIKTKHIKIQNEILTLIGYYLAEGTLDFKYYYKHYGTPKNKRQVNKNNDNYYRISFSFAKDEQRYIEEIKNIAEKLQIKYKIYRYRKEIDFIELFSKRVYTFLYQFGKGALNKHLPMWALGLDNAQKMILLKSLWNGDGSGDIIEKLNGKIKNSALTTVSPILAKQTWFMLLNMNIPASIYKRMIKPNKLKNGHEIISRHEIYNIGINSNINKRGKRIAFDDRYIYLPIKKIEKKTINDFVYNLEVEKDNSYLAEGFAVHNCYALIMSNAGAEVVFDVPMKRPTKKRKTKRLGTKLYQGIDNPIINIDIKLIPVYSTMVYEKVWMNENKMSEWADGIQKSVYKYANHKRKFHKLGIYFVEDLKKPKVRSRQMYIGRRKLMVSNKPYIKKQPPAII
jgi:Fe-S cluster assembly protein SufB